MYYDIGKTLSYNCLLNMVVGNRGCWKTSRGVQWAINDFIKNGNQFIYIRRFGSEFKEMENFFDIQKKFNFPEVEFDVKCRGEKGGKFYINGELAGYYLPLSTAGHVKGVNYDSVTKIIFDEFLITEGVNHYLKNEQRKLLSFADTVSRKRAGFKIFLFSNAPETFTNDYFLYFDLAYPNNKAGVFVNRERGALLELVQDPEFIEMQRDTEFGKLIKGTDYEDYSIDNKFLGDTLEFISKKTGKANCCFVFIYKGQKFGVWIDYVAGKFWVSNDIDPSNVKIYALTHDDHTPNTLLLRGVSGSTWLKPFADNYKLGNVYFESPRIKTITREVIKLLIY